MDNYHIIKYPSNINNTPWFSHVSCSQKIGLSETSPDIGEIISSLSEAEIISVKILKAFQGQSLEGQYLTGKKAAIEIKIKSKLLYVSSQNIKALHILETSFLQIVSVVIPCLIEGTEPEVLFCTRQLEIEVFIDSDYTRPVNHRSVFKSISLYAYIHYIPTFEPCCVQYYRSRIV